MKKIQLAGLALAALTSAQVASAAVPARIQLTCQSPEIGRTEISLTNPSLNGDQRGYYAIEAKRSDRSGRLVGEPSYPVDTSANIYRAEVSMNEGPGHLDNEPILILKLPALGVNWSRNSSSCYVQAPVAGFDLEIGLNSKKIVNSKYREPMVNPYETNPEVSFVIIPGVGFGEVREVLHGEYCPRINDWKTVNNISCELTVTN